MQFLLNLVLSVHKLVPPVLCPAVPSAVEGKHMHKSASLEKAIYLVTSEKLVLFVSVNMLEPMSESSSGSCWCFFSVKWKIKFDAEEEGNFNLQCTYQFLLVVIHYSVKKQKIAIIQHTLHSPSLGTPHCKPTINMHANN